MLNIASGLGQVKNCWSEAEIGSKSRVYDVICVVHALHNSYYFCLKRKKCSCAPVALHNALATRSSGRILYAQTYPMQEVYAEEGGGH